MSDVDFAALRERLEADIRPPAFADIRARRRRRTRHIVTAAGLAVLVVLAGTAAAAAVLGPRAPMTPADPTPSPARSASVSPAPTGSPAPNPSAAVAAGGPPEALGLTATSSGALYALVGRCSTDCTHYTSTLLRSTDLGGSWSTVGPLPQLGNNPSGPLVAGGSSMWIIDGTVLWGSHDGGHTWSRTKPDLPVTQEQRVLSAAGGGTLWLAADTTVLTATGGRAAARTSAQPSGISGILALTAVDDRSAIVAAADSNYATSWYGTTDGGAHWSRLTDPCRNIPPAASANSGPPHEEISVGPDGSRWVVCGAEPSAGQMVKYLVVSTDSGRTWTYHGALESSGYATDVYPVGHGVAWRTGVRAAVYRTTDGGTQWTAVTREMQEGGPLAFIAYDQKTAVYVDSAARDAVHVTRDGGRTWTTHQLPTKP